MRVISFAPSPANCVTPPATPGLCFPTQDNSSSLEEPSYGSELPNNGMTSSSQPQYESISRNASESELTEAGLKNRKTDGKVRHRKQPKLPPHGGKYIKVVSIIYAILLTVTGFLLALAEALSNTWLGTSTNAAFVTYLLVAGTIFLIFLQFYLLRLPASPPANQSGGQLVKSLISPVVQRFACMTQPQQPQQNTTNDATASSVASLELSTSPSYDNDVQPTVTSLRAVFGRQDPNNGTQRSVTIYTSMSDGQNIASRIPSCRSPGPVQRHVTSAANSRRPSVSSGFSHVTEQPRDSLTNDDDDDDTMFWLDLHQLGDLFSHQGTSLYLRLGALIFGLGNVIECGVEIQNWLQPDSGCPLLQYYYGWTFILRLIFIVFQTFVLFKGTPVKIVRYHSIAEFGFLHLIATNLCLWLQTLIREIALMFEEEESDQHASETYSTHDNHDNFTQSLNDSCESSVLLTITVYLYPFILEYSLIAIGAIGSILYNGIGKSARDDNEHMAMGFKNLVRVFKYGIKIDNEDEERGKSTHDIENGNHGNHGNNATFAKSHTGLFAGILLLAVVITSVVLSYFNTYSSNLNNSELIYHITDIILHGFLLIASCLALYLTNRLSYIDRPISIDDFLLFVSMSGCLAYELSVIFAGVATLHDAFGQQPILEVVSSVLATTQTILQTILILYAMRRYPSTTSDVTNMPGRGTFAFLIVANIAAWIERTMKVRHFSTLTAEGHFYGSSAWILLTDVNLPLLLFYRFHSSVCFADIWHVAYTPLQCDAIKRQSKIKQEPQSTPATATAATTTTTTAPVPRIMITVPTPTQTVETASWNAEDAGS